MRNLFLAQRLCLSTLPVLAMVLQFGYRCYLRYLDDTHSLQFLLLLSSCECGMQDCLLLWSEEDKFTLALSFQTKEGRQDIVEKINEAQVSS